jgi:L-threonylcarbamoyladenylate synthase
LAEAVAALEAGQVLAAPTETFYGLVADAFNVQALCQLNRLKRKPADTPILVLLADPSAVHQVSDALPERFHALADMFWPGPLTLVIPAAPGVPSEISGGRGTVAVRVPGLALPRRVAARLGRPITGISANLHGEQPCRTALDVSRTFPDCLGMILDGGPTPGGAPSTILDISVSPPRILRRGIVPSSSLRALLSDMADTPL